MLDTHARKYVQPIINRIGMFCIRMKLSATKLTVLALILGISSACFHYLKMPVVSISFLWFSGLVDALDGTVARLSNSKSNLGAFLDITFDRVVEIAILYSFLFLYPHLSTMIFVLCTSFLLSMTVFLTVGSLSKNKSKKAFYYQAGITERTETFLFFTLMILFPNYTQTLGYIFAALVFITIIIRFVEALKLMK